jgi:hypothetical protein
MANSTTNLDLLQVAQAGKETTANALHDAGSPATIFGRQARLTSGLTWAYYGGRFRASAGTYSTITNATLALSASTTNYIEVTVDGVVSSNTSAFTAGRIPLYTVVTGAATVTSYTDERLGNQGDGRGWVV